MSSEITSAEEYSKARWTKEQIKRQSMNWYNEQTF